MNPKPPKPGTREARVWLDFGEEGRAQSMEEGEGVASVKRQMMFSSLCCPPQVSLTPIMVLPQHLRAPRGPLPPQRVHQHRSETGTESSGPPRPRHSEGGEPRGSRRKARPLPRMESPRARRLRTGNRRRGSRGVVGVGRGEGGGCIEGAVIVVPLILPSSPSRLPLLFPAATPMARLWSSSRSSLFR